jgi:O-antigen/teichoic acid export membrane protein
VKIRENFVFNIIQSVSTVLFPLVTFPYAARVLGPDGIGAANFAENFCRYFMLFAALGIPIYGVREIAKVSSSLDLRSKVFSEIITIHFVASVLSVIAYGIVVLSFAKFQSYNHIYWLGGLYILSNTFSIEWFFNGLSEFKFIAIRAIVIRFVFIFGLFLLVKTSSDVFWYFSLNVLVLIINNLVNLYVWRKKARLILVNLEIKKHLKPLFYIFLSTVAISLYILIDTLILGFIKGDLYVGYYSLVSKLNKVPLTFIVALGAVLIPQLTKSAHDKDFETFNRLIDKSVNFVVMLGVPITIGLLICSKSLILLFSGSSFLPAELSMQLMTPVCLLIGLSNIYGMQILIPLGKDKQLLKSVCIGTFLSLVLNFVFIPIWEDKGAAMANLSSELAVTLATGYFAAKATSIKSPLKLLTIQFLLYCPIVALCFYIGTIIHSDIGFIVSTGIIMLISFLLINIKLLKIPLAVEIFTVLKQKLGYV